MTSCPECGLPLTLDNCTVFIAAKSDTYENEFMTNLTDSHFCKSCPVVVFNSDKIEEAVIIGSKREDNLRYLICGIVNFNAIPEEKRHLEIGIEGNPVPLVHFLPDLNKTTIINDKKTGRNEPCPCGSRKKYKKCCG